MEASPHRPARKRWSQFRLKSLLFVMIATAIVFRFGPPVWRWAFPPKSTTPILRELPYLGMHRHFRKQSGDRDFADFPLVKPRIIILDEPEELLSIEMPNTSR